MRQLTSYRQIFRQGGAFALLLVSALPLAAQTPPSSPPSVTKASQQPGSIVSLRDVEREMQQIEARIRERATANPNPSNLQPNNQKKKKIDPDRKRLNWLRSYHYRMTLMANENGEVDRGAIERARAARDRMTPARLSAPPKKRNTSRASVLAFPIDNLIIDTPPTSTPRWDFIGPTNLQSPSAWAFGPEHASGRINGVTFDPNRVGTYYIAAPLGGVWKTVDRGKTWTALMDSMPGLAATCVTVDPNNSNILYVGTGDHNGFDGLGYGLLKSTDAGATWTTLGAGQFGFWPIRRVWVDPTNSQHLLLTAGGSGVFRSNDGGQSFTPLLGVPNNSLASNVLYNTNRTVLYASVDGAGIYRSTDNGQNWTRTRNSGGRVDIAPSQVDPLIAYALDDGSNSAIKTTDGGQTWFSITNNLPSSEWSQSFYDFYIACSKSKNRDMVWVGLLDVILSKDGGTSWQPIGLVYTDSALTHTDQHAIGFNPKNNSEILIGNDGGVYHMTFNPDDDYIRIETLNSRLGVTQFYGLDIHPSRDNYVLGGTQDNATPRANNSNTNWDNVGSGDGGHAFINPLNIPNQYSTSQSYVDAAGEDWLSMNRTDNTWGSSLSIDTDTIEGPMFITAEAMDRTRPQFLFAGGINVVRYDSSSSAAGTWTQTDDDVNMPLFTDTGTPAFVDYRPAGQVSAMGVHRGVDPTDPKIVFAGTTRGGVFYSDEDGANFHRIDTWHRRIPPPPFGMGEPPDGTPVIEYRLPQRAITSIQGSIFSINTVFVTMGGTGGGHVFRGNFTAFGDFTPAGGFWTDISGNLPDVPVYTLAILPYEQGRRMYAGTEVGVFYTENGGQSWTNATAPLGLPNTKVNRLEFNASTGTLTAATYGRGMWQLKAGDDVLLQLNCVLQYYRGSKSRLNALTEIFIVGQDKPAFDPIEVKQGPLTVAGYFVANVSSRGTFDVYITVPRFLRKLVPNVSIISTRPVSTGTMFCGDVNGDNAINGTDLNLVQQALGRYTTAAVDLDGDGRVTARDLSIVQTNQGRQGD